MTKIKGLSSIVVAAVLGAGCVADGGAAHDSDDSVDGKADGASSTLFGPSGPSTLALVAPLQPAFAAAHAGIPGGIFPVLRVTDPFVGTLGYGALALETELEVRGNSSLEECAFPKLKANIDRLQAAGTQFDGARKIKIGTHCGEGGNGTIGRLRDEIATWREAAVYQLMRALMMPAQLAKPLTIDYTDSTTSATLTRKAFIFEHIDLTAGRLGGQALADPELWTGNPRLTMSMQAIVRVHMFEALIGNWDWRLLLEPSAADGSQLWNIEAVQMPDTLLPIPSDFDLSSAVTARVAPAPSLDPRVLSTASPLVRQAATYLVSESGPLFPDAELHAARDHFMARRASLTAVLAEVPVDDAGRANLIAHVDAFYTALERLDEIMAAVR